MNENYRFEDIDSLLANAASLLDDPDPEAWGWAADLLDRAVELLAGRAAGRQIADVRTGK